MKRVLTIVVALLLTLNLIACEDFSKDFESYYDENGNHVLVSDSGNSVFAEKIPADIPYNESKFSLAGVDVYEHYYSGYYEHALIVIVTLTMNELSESELHWLKEEDLDINIYVTCDDNLYDFDRLDYVGCCDYDNNVYKYIYCTPFGDGSRYSFVGSEITTVVSAEQKATYDYTDSKGKTSKCRKNEKLYFDSIVAENVPGMDKMPTATQRYFGAWITSKALGIDG